MKKFISLLLAVLVVVIIMGMLLGGVSPGIPVTGNLADIGDIPQLSLQGFSRVNIGLDSGGFSILLASGCKELSMVTSQEQIHSIAMGLEKRINMRPLSHDLFGSMVEEFGVEVLMVRVESLREGTYYAKLVLRQGNKILNMDSRPSDAIAVAVRTGSPVYINNNLMEQYGINIC